MKRQYLLIICKLHKPCLGICTRVNSEFQRLHLFVCIRNTNHANMLSVEQQQFTVLAEKVKNERQSESIFTGTNGLEIGSSHFKSYHDQVKRKFSTQSVKVVINSQYEYIQKPKFQNPAI